MQLYFVFAYCRASSLNHSSPDLVHGATSRVRPAVPANWSQVPGNSNRMPNTRLLSITCPKRLSWYIEPAFSAQEIVISCLGKSRSSENHRCKDARQEIDVSLVGILATCTVRFVVKKNIANISHNTPKMSLREPSSIFLGRLSPCFASNS